MANEYDDDDIITLQAKNGEDIDFVEIAGIAYRGKFYAILQPVELTDGMSEDDALVFQVTRGNDGEDKFAIELDDKIIDAVFAEYNRLLDEAENDDKNINKKTMTANSRGNKNTTKGKAAFATKAGKKVLKLILTVAAGIVALIAILLLVEGLSSDDNGGVIFAVVIMALDLIIYFAILHAIRKREERNNGGSSRRNKKGRR